MNIRTPQYTSFVCILFPLLFFSCGQKPSESISSINEEEKTSPVPTRQKTLLFFGNSLTAGYGLEPEESFAGIVQEYLDSLNLDYEVVNAGLSGETTASGLNRLDWFLEVEPAVFFLELGGNDGLRGIQVLETKKNLKQIIQKVRAKYPATSIVLAGMQVPPNMGQEYSQNFRDIFIDLADNENVTLIPFLLEGVAGDPDLNLPDGIHPSKEGHRIVAETVWDYIEPLL